MTSHHPPAVVAAAIHASGVPALQQGLYSNHPLRNAFLAALLIYGTAAFSPPLVAIGFHLAKLDKLTALVVFVTLPLLVIALIIHAFVACRDYLRHDPLNAWGIAGVALLWFTSLFLGWITDIFIMAIFVDPLKAWSEM